MYDILIKHKEHLPDQKSVEFIIEVVEFYIAGGIPQQIQNREDTIESVVNSYCRFFLPPSFCT